jgi:hypothetical protein
MASSGNIFVSTPKLMKSVIRVPLGSSATVRAIGGPPVEFAGRIPQMALLSEQYWA